MVLDVNCKAMHVGLRDFSKEKKVAGDREVRGEDRRVKFGLTQSQYIRAVRNEERFHTAEIGSNATDVRK